jgi:Putative beta-barrel porin-2, OmpL-like. bbp2
MKFMAAVAVGAMLVLTGAASAQNKPAQPSASGKPAVQQAQTPSPQQGGEKPTDSSAKPASWWDTFSISGHLDGGVTYNTMGPSDGINFGNLFGDRANTALLNQALITVQRPIDPKSTNFDFGFKFQAMYGSDARYTHYLGELDEVINDQSQIDIVEAFVQVHLPFFTAGGIDMKIGQYVTLEGAEVIYAPDNPLYSHSYIFNFGTPFKHTGILTTTHVNDVLDIYAGIDSGVNTSLGCCNIYSGDNNAAVAFHGGIGFNLLGGDLTILATTHIGAENPNTPAVAAACGCDPNAALRYLNDITATWKANNKLTLITDLNYIRDDGFNADGYGVAQYAMYKFNDLFRLVGRAEIWRDNTGFFVASYPGYLDFVKVQHGDPSGILKSGGATTYMGLTLGLNITPTVPEPASRFIKGLIFRPEVRFDSSLNGTTPFGGGTSGSQVTIAGDVIIKF